jgi:hypothetical protein
VSDPADRLPRRMARVRAVSAEGGSRRVLRPRRSGGASVVAESLPEETLRALAVDAGTLWTGARLVPSLHRFFEERARRAA